MRYKRFLFCLALMLLCTNTIIPGQTEETASVEPADILVVYSEEEDRKTGADNLSALAQVLFCLRHSVDFVEAADARAVIGGYENVIWCASAGSRRLDPSMLSNYSGKLMVLGQTTGLEGIGIETASPLSSARIGVANYAFGDLRTFSASVDILNPGRVRYADYSNGTLQALGQEAPLVSGREGLHYIPLMDYTTEFAKAVLSEEIAQWLWPYENRMNTFTQYVVLDELYPFFDPFRLKTLVEYMVEKKMNFVLSVMPIYENADYPAMREFCEVLRFAQANGGGVIMHAPIIQGTPTPETLADYLTRATQNYFEQDVYLLGLEVPSEWLFLPGLRAVLGRYRTLFFSDTDAFPDHTVGEYRLTDYLMLGSQQITPAFRLDETGVGHVPTYASAVYLDVGMKTDKELLSVIDTAQDSPIPMQSLWDMSESVYCDEGYYLTWDLNTLIVNDSQRFNVYTPSATDKDFDYRRDVYYRFVANLTNQNNFLIIGSAVMLFIFLLLSIRSRKQMHRRFLKKTILPKQNEVKGE